MKKPLPKEAEVGLRITPPALVKLDFKWEGCEAPTGEMEIEYSLALHRFARLVLGVQLEVSIVGIEGLVGRAAYRMVCEIDAESAAASDPEKGFVPVVTRIAPMAMFPFLREALASVAQRALFPNLVLPVVNVGRLWTSDEIQIPPTDEENPSES